MLQYNLRALFGLTVGAAIFTWVIFVLPGEIGGIIIMMAFLVAGSSLVAGTVYLRGYRQAFCIGCLSSHALILIVLFSGPMRYGYSGDFEFKIAFALSMVVELASGAAAMGMRYLSLRPSPPRPTRPGTHFPGFPNPQAENHAAELPLTPDP